MKWLRGSSIKWALVGLGLLTTSCAGVIGVGAAAVVVGAGVLAMTCYDRVSVTVTDQLTATKLCDAKVTFTEDGSVTEASSCYTAALSTGKYQMKVERPGLVTYEAPIEVNTGSKCRHTVQTIYVAMERPGASKGASMIGPPAPLPSAAGPRATTAPPAGAPSGAAPEVVPPEVVPPGSAPGAPSPSGGTPAAPVPSAVPPAPPAAPRAAPPSAAPPPATTSFPNTP